MGEGTFGTLKAEAGGDGVLSKPANTDSLNTSTIEPFAAFGRPFFEEPLRFFTFDAFLVVTIFPLTTDTVTSSSTSLLDPCSVSDSSSLDVS